MKKIFFLIALGFAVFTTPSCTNDSKEKVKDNDEISVTDVPGSVKTAFNEKYSGATNVAWEGAHENNQQTYKAKFVLNGKKMKAEFDANGVFIKENEDS